MEQPAISTAVQAPGSTMAARLADQVVWLRNQHIQVAELRLHPRDLGSLQIRIDHNNEGTQIQFVAPHQHVRDVLDQNLVQLKEMFRDAGINLVQVNVSAEQRDHAGRGQQGMDDVTLRGSRQQSTQAENDAGDEAMEVLGVSRLGGSSPYQLDFYI